MACCKGLVAKGTTQEEEAAGGMDALTGGNEFLG